MKMIRVYLLFLTVFLAGPLSAKTLDTCFSPKGHCDQVLVSWIDASIQTLDGAIYGLTDENIAQAFIRAKQRGVQVRLVHDESQAAGENDVTQQLLDAGIPIHIQRGSEGGILHDKFLVIDGKYVLTGSFNWTHNAKARNDENFVVLDDQAPNFQTEFDRLWSQPEGVGVATRPVRHRHSPSPWWGFSTWRWRAAPTVPPAKPYPASTPKKHHHRKRHHKAKRQKHPNEVLMSPIPPPTPVLITP
jgi:phosphatidylserine/phosphatidylglycerophosphate/cardiolipin synthase-like enzyme